jgi:hypothetical protein
MITQRSSEGVPGNAGLSDFNPFRMEKKTASNRKTKKPPGRLSIRPNLVLWPRPPPKNQNSLRVFAVGGVDPLGSTTELIKN